MARPIRWHAIAVVAFGALVSTGCALDEAALIQPGDGPIEAEPGQLRVLSHRDDPTIGDQWIDVLEPDPAVVSEGTAFREDRSRAPGPDEPADVRRLFHAVDEGHTVLVQVNCRDCEAGVPSTALDHTEIHVWEFVVGEAQDEPVSAARNGARTDTTTTVAVGDHVVVTRAGRPASSVEVPGGLVQIARHRPERGDGVHVDVFAAVAPTEGSIRYLVDGSEEVFSVAVR